MATMDGLAAVRSCDTYLCGLNDDGILVESFDYGKTWNRVDIVHNFTGWLQALRGLTPDDLNEGIDA